MDVSQDWFGLNDIFTVHHQFHPEYTMGGRMLRAQVKDKGFLTHILLQ
jgi:hypothetical protein